MTNDPKLAFLKKLFDLQTAMSEYSWEKDGINRHQSYRFISEAQYKTNFKKALKQVGLLWFVDEIGHEFVGSVSDKMHLILTNFKGTITDPDTGEFREYFYSGSGADNGDKALYKAYTGGLKFFISSNFLVSEDNDPENDETPVSKPSYTKPEEREEIKAELSDPERPATEVQIKALKRVLDKLVKKFPEKHAFANDVITKTENFTKVTASFAERVIVSVSEELK